MLDVLGTEGPTRTARALPVLLDVSLSKARKLRSCPRSVYWEVAGPRHPDPATAARVRRLKMLTGLEAALGIGLHEVARRIATALRDGRRPPRYEEGLAYLREQLNTLWTATREQHDHAPERDGCLRERWYGETVPEETLVRVRTRLHSQYRRLYHHPAWETVRQAGRGDIVVCDALDHLPLHLDGLPAARLYAAPDLAMIVHSRIELPNYGIPAPGPTALLIDWKTGKWDPLRRDDALDQACVYAWYVAEKLELPMGGWATSAGSPTSRRRTTPARTSGRCSAPARSRAAAP